MNASSLFKTPTGAVLAAALAVVCLGSMAQAPSAPTNVKLLLRTSLSGDDTKEVILASAQFLPGATTGPHTHPGDEYATVLEGAVEVIAQGREPRRVASGESYHNARGVVHETRTASSVPARVISTFVIDRGAPITQPAKR